MNLELAPFSYEFSGATHSLNLKTAVRINSNGCYLIAGPSGVGKSTFLKILKGFYPEFLEGKMNPEIKSFKDSFYLFQNPYTQLIQSSPLMEFLFSMENREFFPEEIKAQFSLLHEFQLTEVVQRKNTRSLSHGECQKLLFASLIAAKPEWVFLDEPTAFIDPLMRKDIYQMIEKEKNHRGFLIIDHHLDEMKNICDGVFELRFEENKRDVEILFHSSITEFQKNEDTKKTHSYSGLERLAPKKIISEAQIILKDISPFYEREKKLFAPLNLEIETATITTFVGRSGLGKSTLFKAILGVHPNVFGSITMLVNKKEIAVKKRHEHLGFLFQNPEIHFFFDTVEEEIKMTGAKVDEHQFLIELFGLQYSLQKNPFFLSEGQKRRLSFLLVLLQKKEFLVLDEPTFGQDEEQVAIISECLKIAKKMGFTILIISHDPKFYRDLSDRIVEIKEVSE